MRMWPLCVEQDPPSLLLGCGPCDRFWLGQVEFLCQFPGTAGQVGFVGPEPFLDTPDDVADSVGFFAGRHPGRDPYPEHPVDDAAGDALTLRSLRMTSTGYRAAGVSGSELSVTGSDTFFGFRTGARRRRLLVCHACR